MFFLSFCASPSRGQSRSRVTFFHLTLFLCPLSHFWSDSPILLDTEREYWDFESLSILSFWRRNAKGNYRRYSWTFLTLEYSLFPFFFCCLQDQNFWDRNINVVFNLLIKLHYEFSLQNLLNILCFGKPGLFGVDLLKLLSLRS